MKEKYYNILITINSGYARYAAVMLTSLFENNQECFHVYCLYSDLDEKNSALLAATAEKYHNKLHFIQVEKTVYKDFPTTQNLTVECYFILLAHKLLPQNMERILYLDSDMIVEGKIDELYNQGFDNQYMVVCGQSYQLIEGNYYGIGARPELGQCFNSGVILFNLQKFREDISEQTYLDAAREADYHFELADQGILNIVFADKVKYIDTLKYNFRISIYEDYIRDGNPQLAHLPVIIHYVIHDYYRVGYVSKPWKLTLNKQEYRLLLLSGLINEKYELREADRMNLWMQRRWWVYAKKTQIYFELRKEMKKEKKALLCAYQHKDIVQTFVRIYKYQRVIDVFRRITEGNVKGVSYQLRNTQYRALEKYIDSIDADSAITTMRNLFRCNCDVLKKEKVIKIAFIVYSSAEWQCEELYRLLEKDKRFAPVILVCGFRHGTEKTIRETYINTCAYFRRSGQPYHMEYAGFCDGKFINQIFDKFQILIYLSPFNLGPREINMAYRNISQLCIYIPYGYYVEDKRDVYYVSYYEQIVFKLSWFYFCYCKLDKEITSRLQRLAGYNIRVSGLPKIDSLLEHKFHERKNLWKGIGSSAVKIIWAPHFNLRKGMNGTFGINYKWFYTYAKEHPEISWVVRPHPRMEWGVLQYGVFASSSEYTSYLDAWDALPNASVVVGGDYYDIFETSDAMILDSLSFLTEYQYTGKPLLWLEAEEPRSFSELGEKLLSVSYKAKGGDFAGIEAFIENVKSGIDPGEKGRKEYREQFLEDREDMGKTATEFIYDMIIREIF